MDKRNRQKNRWVIIRKMFMDQFITAALIELASTGAVLIDGIVVSRTLSPDAMAAFGISYPFFTITAVFFGMFASGMQTMISHEMGNGNIDACNRIFCATVYIAGIFSIISMAFSFVGARGIAYLLGGKYGSVSLLEGAASYIRGLSFGVPPIILCAVLAPAIRMDSGSKRVVASLAVYFVLDVLFDLFAARMGMGLLGIGLATAFALLARLAIMLLHFRKKDHLFHFVPLKTSVREFTHLLSLGTENAMRRVGNVIRPVFVNRLILYYGGAVAMTAMSVRGNLGDFSGILAVGIADAVGLLAGVYYGEKNMEAEYALGKTAHHACALFCGTEAVVLLLLSRVIAVFYAGEQSAILSLTWISIIGVALQCPLQALLRARITYLQRVMRTRNMEMLIFLSTLISPMISALVLGRLFGTYGVLFCYTVSDFISLAAVWIYYALKHHRLVPTPQEYLNFPEEFHVNPGDVIALDIRSQSDAVLASEQIALFCKGHGIASATGNRASLCFEEMAQNTITQGFPLCKAKIPMIDFRMVISGDTLVLRLQDNCPKSDVGQRIKAIAEQAETGAEDTELSMRMISGLADSTTYAYSYDTNIVFIEFNIVWKDQTSEMSGTGEQS